MAATDYDAVKKASSENSQMLSPAVADTLAKLRDLLEDRYGVDKVKIAMETELGSLGLDSLSLVECAFDLEKSLNVVLSDLPHELSTVGDLVHYVTEVRSRSARLET